MTKKGEVREMIWLSCEECKSRNYYTEKNKRNDPDRVTLKKFCRRCRQRRDHREVR